MFTLTNRDLLKVLKIEFFLKMQYSRFEFFISMKFVFLIEFFIGAVNWDAAPSELISV